MQMYSRRFGNERKRECVRGCSERESEIAREIGREKMNAGIRRSRERGKKEIERERKKKNVIKGKTTIG